MNFHSFLFNLNWEAKLSDYKNAEDFSTGFSKLVVSLSGEKLLVEYSKPSQSTNNPLESMVMLVCDSLKLYNERLIVFGSF